MSRAAGEHPPGGVKQEQPEDPRDPFEAVEQRDARGDEERPQNNGAADAPQEGLMLACDAGAEAAEDDKEDDQVVDAERTFYGVAGDELKGRLAAVSGGDPHGEETGYKDKQCCPEDGQAGGAPEAAAQSRVGGNQRHDCRVKARPPQP